MANVTKLLELYDQLTEPSKFAVLLYARMKVVRDMAELCKPYVQERRSSTRVQFPRAHWVDQRARS